MTIRRRSSSTWVALALVAVATLWASRQVYRAWEAHEDEEESEHRSEARAPNAATSRGADAAVHGEEEPELPVKVSRDEHGHAVLSIREEAQRTLGLATTRPAAADYRPSQRAYGALQADPARTFALRAPVAGYLELPAGAAWPRLGDAAHPGAVIGAIRPRFTPSEQYDITTKWMQAQSEVEEIKADLAAQRASYESKRRLNKDGKIIADRAIEEAEARVKADEARLDAAIRTARLLEGALQAGGDALALFPLKTARAGEVVEVGAGPGEAVDSGQVVLRTADFQHLLARVEAPQFPSTVPMPANARVSIPALNDAVLSGRVIAETPLTDSQFQGRAFLISVDTGSLRLRPGMAVVADLELPAAPASGVVVPRSAVVRYGGSAWVYVEVSKDLFNRRMIPTDAPLESGWFVAAGLAPGDEIVVAGAGSLISEELRSQIESEEEDEE